MRKPVSVPIVKAIRPRPAGPARHPDRLSSRRRKLAVLSLRITLLLVIATCCAAAQITVPASNIINTVAGAGLYAGDGGAATSARLNAPGGLAMDSAGNIYIADIFNNCVRKVTIASGVITTLAGSPAGGYGGDGGPATLAQLEQPQGVALDALGNVYIADTNNNRIRKITVATGIITTVAGNGTAGYSGDGGSPINAELYYPTGVALDSSGNLLIADSYNNVVRELAVSTGNIITLAGNVSGGFAGDGGPAAAAQFSTPQSVAVDSSNNIYIADTYNNRIRKITAATGVITTVAGSANRGYSGDNGAATSAELTTPWGVAVDSAGNIYIADSGNNRLRKVTASTGIITTMAGNGSQTFSGDGGPGTSAGLDYPIGVVADASKNVLVADTANRVRKVTASTGIISTVAGSTTYGGNGGKAAAALLAYPQASRIDASGNLYIVDTYNQVIRELVASTGIISTVAGNGVVGYSGDGGAATSAELNYPGDIAFDSSGNLYIADTFNSCIRKVTVATKIITTIAGQCGLDTFQNALQPGDNGPATSATLWYPSGIALDSAGNLLIADDHNSVVRKVSKANGYITLFAGSYNYSGSCPYSGDGGPATSAGLCAPYSLVLDSAGDVFISDIGNNDIREVLASNGVIQTVAGSSTVPGASGDGGSAFNALLNQPQGMAIDSGGNLYVADFGNNSIRKINLSGNLDITTVAGNGIPGFAGDTQAAVSAELFWPYSVAVDAAANLYIADTNNNRIRAVGKPRAVAPVVSWPTPATMTYGTPLSATQLDATAAIPGTFSYTPAAGQVLTLGAHTLAVTFTPTDSVDYTTATAQTTISVIQTVPKITWATPAAISAGTALSATQLNATANTAGTFTYSPAAGVVLAAGTQTLSVSFAPSNTSEYSAATATVQLTVTASATAGIIHTFAGTGTAGYNADGVAAITAELNGPRDIAVDSSGNVYIADTLNYRIRRVATGTGIITTFAGTGSNGSGSAPTASGTATSIALGSVAGLGVDTSGNVYYADSALGVVRKITVSTGIMAIVAGNGTAGQYSGDGGVATSAALNAPSAVAVDSAGNLYISDTHNDVIRKVTASTGIISTIAGTGLKAGYSGDGGAATSATLSQPAGIAVDASSNIYVSDVLNCVVRKITAATGIITTYAGNGTQGSAGDGGPAVSAELTDPQGLSLSANGDLYLIDLNVSKVREVIAATGLISTVTGTGVWGYNGDGIPATTAELKSPFGVRVASNGNFYIADTENNRVRVVGANTMAPNFSWITPAPIYYGTALSAAQLDAVSNGIPGTITYSEQVGTVLKAGSYNLSAVFVPTSNDYSIETVQVVLTVNPAPAPVSWPQPADITNGAALSATQLDATSTIAGSFVYSPAVGTLLTQGPHLLSVTFTPVDTIDYVPNTVTVAITVSGGTTTYDAGTVAFVANGTTLGTASYGQNSTPATIAAALATSVNGNVSTTVKLTAVDNSLYITAVTAGAAGDAISYAVENTAYNTSAFPGPSFPDAVISGNLEGGAASGTDAGKLVYDYSDGYDAVGNMTSSNDLVMGKWTFSPDHLNRLVGATNVPVSTPATSYYCWSYDSFGNRNLQGVSTAAFASPAPACTPQESGSYQGVWAHYAAGNNRFSNTQQAIGGVGYDGAGNILNDGVNQYLYDGDGRICAVASSGTGAPVLTGYIYNAEGERVSKGSITVWSCDPATNGFKPLSDYVVGQSGEQMTEMGMDPSGSMAWQHTNVYAFGQVMATYDNAGLHFYLNDPLGTRRAQTDYAGVLEQTCLSLPFGDELICTSSQQYPTEHHFTGKERDTESGLDYFGARYYASAMGRFLSPDDPFADRDPSDPQSWNLYSYVRNNPLSNTDDDGRSVNICTDNGNGGQQCSLLSNDQYNAAQQSGNGSLNVPSLNSVGTNGSGSITDANGNSVGSATYVSDGGADYYGNQAGYNQLAGASRVVNAAGSLEMNIMAPYAGALAGCMSGGSAGSCGANLALSLLPEVAELKAGATLLREAAAAGKGAEILSKGGGAAQAAKEFEAIPAVSEQINGATRIKTLSDGSKAVLYESTGGSGRTTISIQSAAGHTETKIRY